MQPAAPETERKRCISNRIGPAADPASSFKDGERDLRRCKPRGGADSGGARTDDDDLEIVCAARKHEGSMRIDLPCQFSTERKNTRRTRKIAETASRSCYKTRLLARLELERVGYAVRSTKGTAGSGFGANFHEGRYGIMCLKLRLTRGAAAAAVFGT
jgi:hypothetical protein